ncbi:MAG: hypothetical protein AB8F95_08910 [Bacteroidia bacterium]
MKNFIYILLALMAFCLHTTASAQSMKQKIHMRIDSLGDAHIDISMNMDASSWQNWTQTVGNNPALLKREIERTMPGYFLDDFKLDKNDMDRSFKLSLRAYGVCKVDKKGRWSLETDEKNPDITELTEHKFMLVSSPEEFGGQIQQTYIVEFPEVAQNVKVDKDAFGKTSFEFKMQNPARGGFNFLRWGGVLLMLGGVVLAVVSGKKK